MKTKLTVHTVLFDNQDGGYTMYIANSPEEIEEIRKRHCSDDDDEGEYDPDDEYQSGYPSTSELEYEMVGGQLKLYGSFHAGQ